ncbi:heavy metal-associated isoprenylated plant protein 3 [Morus notabilis]|uniref:heavy metal-associated isoprenylated plant protein 3 n=1 Tax=Morus notabilis TaxID=981085 RepID=UPI000CED6182|nr:heavy metal-associated isoprenylated plant protein 3 [Morus notabilis]
MGEKKNGGEKKKNGDGGDKKKEDNSLTVVLKVDMHCEGCATKIVKTVKSFDGVDDAKAEFAANKLTVVGKVDPSKLREMLAVKTKKKVDLISPQPSKKDDNKNDNKKKTDENDNKKKPDEKKPKDKEPPVTTAVLKLRLHCQGCIGKIRKTVTKTKGFNDMSIDEQKELVTVIGSMDMKALAESLQEKLKRPVEIVPPKKEKDGGEKDGGKADNGGGGKKKGGGGGGGGGDGGQKAEGDGGKMEESRMEYMGQPLFGYGYGPGPGFGYAYPPGPGFGSAYPPGPGFGSAYPPGYVGEQLHAPQVFSDENPNACSVM